MGAFELLKLPVRLGVQPLKWVGGVVVTRLTEVGRSNVLDVWRGPWESEAEQHLDDAKQQRDFSRADEQRSLLECIHQCAPRTAEEYEELKISASDKANESQLEELLGPTAVLLDDSADRQKTGAAWPHIPTQRKPSSSS